MTITTYKNFFKQEDSTKQPTTANIDKTLNVKLKNGVSIYEPVFILDFVDYDLNYLRWNNRYYFVNDVIPVANNLCEYHCNMDRLGTEKAYIGNSYQYVLRSSHSSNELITDTFYPATNKKSIDMVMLTDIFTEMGAVFTSGTLTGGYVIGVANGSGSMAGGSITYYYLDQTNFSALKRFMFQSNPTWIGIDTSEISLGLQKALINPLSYIVSCVWYPFHTWTDFGTADTVKLGWYDTGVSCKVLDNGQRIKSASSSVSLPQHPKMQTVGRYLNGAPFSRYSLNVFGFGQIPLDASYFIEQSRVEVQLYADMFTGDGKMVVKTGVVGSTSKNTIAIYNGNIGVPIELSQIKRDFTTSKLSFVSSLATSLADTLGIGSGITSAVDTMMSQPSVSGTNGSSIDYAVAPFILCEYLDIVETNNGRYGSPLCETKKISDIPGYIKCDSVEVGGITPQRLQIEIKNLMEAGFYYE